MKSGSIDVHQSSAPDWKVTLVDTGLDALTGTRIRNVSDHLNDQAFMLTYGDGVSNVDISELIRFHRSSGKLATMTAVRPVARFGELKIKDGSVLSFEEKPQLQTGWINGGFFVFEPGFLDHIPSDNVMLEREPLESVTRAGQLAAFQHEGFWQCMDTKRDVEGLQKLWDTGNAPWVRQ
jgi:glucose-1-phosphate cytidylyltransferase